jgi:hypothetical protein
MAEGLDDLLARLQRLANGEGGAEQREGDLEAVASLVKSGELRDFSFTAELYGGLFALVIASFCWRTPQAQPDNQAIQKAEQIFWGATRFPEFDVRCAETQVNESLIWALGSRLDGTNAQEEWPFLRDVLLWLYENFAARRPLLRSVVAKPLHSFGKFSHKGVPVAPLLQVLGPIIRGFKAPLTKANKALLFEILLPLHRPNEWLQWDRQMPLISMYHKELVSCIVLFLEQQPALIVRCIEAICSHFPNVREANTPKEVLLVSELGSILKYVDDANFRELLPLLLRHMMRLLGSQNAIPVQAVLQWWKDDHFVRLCKGASSVLVPQLLPSLLRGGELFWNPTVNRMTSLVLEKLEQNDPTGFAAAAEDVWGPGRQVPAYEVHDRIAAEEAAKPDKEDPEGPAAKALPGGGAANPQDVSSLKFGMGGWKPPTGGGSFGSKPPLTATGVAPWAFQGGAIKAGGMKQPPLTTTGVAPWAFENKSKASGPLTAMGAQIAGGAPSRPGGAPRLPQPGGGPGPAKGSLGPSPLQAFEEEEEEDQRGAAESPSGIDRVHEYMKRLNPTPEASDGASWEAALMAEAPTLLPTLKFHDLVFVHEPLGSGAFSVVKYARAIQKSKTQSQWPEYAVKVIDTKTMESLGYEVSVNREICVLRMLSHPGIARLVSSFRWRDGAYLVLEYAAKGDLHSVLVRHGKLAEDISCFFSKGHARF